MLQTVAIFQSIVSFCVLNVRSARNKVGDIYDEFSEKKLDFLVATEFWLKPSDPDYHLQVKDFNDLKFINRHRPRRQGGGIATIYRKSFNVNNVLIDFKPKSFEYQSWSQVKLEQVKSRESHWRQITSQVKSYWLVCAGG